MSGVSSLEAARGLRSCLRAFGGVGPGPEAGCRLRARNWRGTDGLCHDGFVRDFHRILLSSEVRELNDEVARLFEDLDRTRPTPHAPHGHCSPPIDVLQTDSSVEVIVDLPGVAADRVRVMLKSGVLVLVGEKPSPYTGERLDGTFHLVERGFGRFARAVRIDGAVDGGAARAMLSGGELRVIVPKIPERRGKEILVPVTAS